MVFVTAIILIFSLVTALESSYPQRTIPVQPSPSPPRAFDIFDHVIFHKLCHQSCEGKCHGKPIPNPISGCFCDDACERMGNCCLLYEQQCLKREVVDANNWVDIVLKRNALPFKCKEIHKQYFPVFEYPIVWGCRSGVYGARKEDIRRCIGKPSSFETSTLAQFRGVVYRNMYCVLCNHPDVDVKDVPKTPPKIQCGKNSQNALDIYRDLGSEAFHDYVTKNCELKNTVDVEKVRYCSDKYNNATLGCDINKELIKGDEAQKLRHLSSNYRAEYTDNITSVLKYVNPHCKRCQGGVPPIDGELFCTASLVSCVALPGGG